MHVHGLSKNMQSHISLACFSEECAIVLLGGWARSRYLGHNTYSCGEQIRRLQQRPFYRPTSSVPSPAKKNRVTRIGVSPWQCLTSRYCQVGTWKRKFITFSLAKCRRSSAVENTHIHIRSCRNIYGRQFWASSPACDIQNILASFHWSRRAIYMCGWWLHRKAVRRLAVELIGARTCNVACFGNGNGWRIGGDDGRGILNVNLIWCTGLKFQMRRYTCTRNIMHVRKRGTIVISVMDFEVF